MSTNSILYVRCGVTPPDGKPCLVCCEVPGSSDHPIQYWNGGALLDQVDLDVAGDGFFGHTRYYCNQASAAYDGLNGFNWYVRQMPSLAVDGGSIAVVSDPNAALWFDVEGSSFVPRYGMDDLSLTEDSIAKTITLVRNEGGGTHTTVFNDLTSPVAPGEFVSHTDARGVTVSVADRTDGLIHEMQRSYDAGGITTTEALVYEYYTSGPGTGRLRHVTYRRRVGSGAWSDMRRAAYDYYGAADADGGAGDLKTVSQQVPDGSSGWETVAVRYFRYYLGGEATGMSHGLKLHIGPESYRRLINDAINPQTATDAALMPYADHYFEYDPQTWSVTKEIAAACETCSGGGGTVGDLLEYTPNPRNPVPDYNVWSMKTVQTHPDDARTIVYTNHAGQPMLRVEIDPGGTQQWAWFYCYDDDSRLIWEAQPSAVSGYDDTYDDLLNFNAVTGLYQHLHDNAGLITITDYYPTTDVLNGAVKGYVASRGLRHGQGGSDVLLRAYTYTSHTDADGNTVYPLASEVRYPVEGSTANPIVTSYAYAWHVGTNRLQQRTVTLPVVSTSQNGSGTAATTIEVYDTHGNVVERTDERGTVSTFTYADPVRGLVAEQVLNDQGGAASPGVNATTNFSYDEQGRLTQILGPLHTVDLDGVATAIRRATWHVHVESAQPSSGEWEMDQELSASGYATGTAPSYAFVLVDPVSIIAKDKSGRVMDQITSRRTTGTGALSATDTFAQADWLNWTSQDYDQGGRIVEQRVYHAIPVTGVGSAGVNYHSTFFSYDPRGRQNRTVTPGGTITRTVWAAPGRQIATWIGTDDTGATDANPAGAGAPNNMVKVSQPEYDGGDDGGDGNLTRLTQYASGGDPRVTEYGYDWRNRRINLDGELDLYVQHAYDNLDRQIQTDRRNTNAAGNLVARQTTRYDDRGRVYEQSTYAIDPDAGTVGDALTDRTWYDQAGNVIQRINAGDGESFTKTTYNALGWPTAVYQGYNPSGVSYAQAATVANDIIIEQVENAYDQAGNLLSQAIHQRLSDTTGTGALSADTAPKARISYRATWYDGTDRQIATADYGAIGSLARPDTAPASSDTVLVSQTGYDDAGRPWETTDPRGIINRTLFDAAGRTTQTVEARDTIASGDDANRTTLYTYTPDGAVATLTAVNLHTGNQVTTYTYGTALADSDIARSDLLRFVAYPGSSGPSDRVAYTYNALGQTATITDRRGNARTFTYDKLGRLTDDRVTTVGGDTDAAVRRLSTAYEVRGLPETFTSADSAAGGSVLNQVKREYDDLGRLVAEFQEHDGAVTSGSHKVQYAYDATTANRSRRTGLTYPSGRIVTYGFGASGGVSDALGRIASIADGATTLAQYTYLGAGTPVRVEYPQPQVRLDRWGGAGGQFDGIDRFGRIVDQRWTTYGGTPVDLDRFAYGYDRNSNRLYEENLLDTSKSELYGPYDQLNRLVNFERGELNGTKDAIAGMPQRSQGWELDPLGNWKQFTTAEEGGSGGQTAPAAPTSLVATANGSSRIDLAWTDNAHNETHFRIERKTGSGGTWSQIGLAAAGTTGFTDYALDEQTTYYYRIRAANTLDSSYSAEDSATTLAATAAVSTHLSDLTPDSVINPYFPYQKDKSVESNTLTIGGQTYSKGLGMHSHSQIVYTLNGDYDTFDAIIGIDDEVGNGSGDGSAQWLVYVDSESTPRYTSPRRTGADGPYTIPTVNISGATTLKLITNTGGQSGDNDYRDHANWAEARVGATGGPSISGSVSTDTSTRNLTSDGESDWIQWNNHTGSINRKSGGGSQFSTYTPAGHQLHENAWDLDRELSWSDGTPTSSNSGTGVGAKISHVGSSMTFTVPASTQERTLKVYAFGWYSNMQLEVSLSDNSVSTWTSAVTGGGSTTYFRTFTVVYRAGSDGQTATIKLKNVAGQQSWGHIGLQGAAVSITDTSGGGGGGAGTPPAAASGLSAEPVSAAQINLAWTDNASDEEGFVIERRLAGAGDWRQVGVTPPNTTAYTDTTGLIAGTQYEYRVIAFNAAGGVVSTNVDNATTPAPAVPAAPTSPSASASGTQVEFTWSHSGGNQSGFEIERATDSGFTANVVRFAVGEIVTEFIDDSADASTTYHYRVRATSEAGASAWTTGVSETTGVAGVVPLVQMNANENTGTTVNNSGSLGDWGTRTSPTPAWSTNTPGTVGGASALDFGTSTGNYVVESPAVVTELGGLTKFTITGWLNNRSSSEGSGGNRVVTWTKGYFSGSSAPGVDLVYRSDGSLHLGVNKWVDDSNARSSSGKITTSSSADSGNWRFFAVTYDSTQGSNNVRFYFGDTSNDATLDVTRSYSQGAVETDIGKLAIGNFNDAARSGNTDRMFRGLIDGIHIFDDALTLAQIQDVQDGITPGGTGTPPAAASGLSADPVSPTQVNLVWTDNASTETGFLIERATDSGFTQNVTRFAVGSNVTRFADTSASADTTYHYRIIATGQGGASTASNTASVTTAKAAGSGTSIIQTRTHDIENRLTEIDDGTSQMPLAHDADGNLTTNHHGHTLIYDAWNRLVEVKDGSTTLWRYGYDALRRRITEDDTHLYHSHQWQVIEERNDSSQVASQYVWSPHYVDAMIARDRDTNDDGTLDERLYVQHDANFNVTAIVDTGGDVMERYEYDPYGMRTVLDEDWTENAGGTAFDFHHGHQGGRYDDATALHHFRNRDYSAELGRWVQQDPLGYVDGMGLYEYVSSQPVRLTDSSGRNSDEPCVCGPDVTRWFMEDLLRHIQYMNSYLNRLRRGEHGIVMFDANVGEELMFFRDHAANLMAHKWMSFHASQQGCSTGKCTNTVMLAGVCLRKNQLGNITFGMISSLTGGVGPFTTPDMIITRAYEDPAVGTYSTEHPHAANYGGFVGTPRKDNLAAFGIGAGIAQLAQKGSTEEEFSQAIRAMMDDPGILSRFGNAAPDDLTFIPEHGGFNTRQCKKCPHPLNEGTMPSLVWGGFFRLVDPAERQSTFEDYTR